ncbi:hypothetical protein DQ04_00221010 [Trypanosoma grayi]|uniref:hypothetical protein n=1 Tax=Trypanosoma grayi TaxID=71804 RepID=UPI0004F49D90|nr:hypothetical protein DQ04_00221010 [Trypanosoma grayi]KEG14998.1 hypothetical protein DQ04_00221010 [Trypanosoma grayi]
MSKITGYSLHHDPSLQEYYEACMTDDSSAEENGSESDRDSSSYWRSSRRSPLRGKARLSLQQRNSVQNAMRDRTCLARRNPDAAAAASLLAKPLEVTMVDGAGGEDADKPPPNTVRGAGVERLIFDALCALRQSPNDSFHASAACGGGPLVWSLRKSVADGETWKKTPLNVRTTIEAFIAGANDASLAEWQLRKLDSSISYNNACVADDAFGDSSQTCTGSEGILLASCLVLRRFAAIVRALLQSLSQWVLQLQGEQTKPGVALPTVSGIGRRVERALLPVRRCVVLMERACCIACVQRRRWRPGGRGEPSVGPRDARVGPHGLSHCTDECAAGQQHDGSVPLLHGRPGTLQLAVRAAPDVGYIWLCDGDRRRCLAGDVPTHLSSVLLPHQGWRLRRDRCERCCAADRHPLYGAAVRWVRASGGESGAGRSVCGGEPRLRRCSRRGCFILRSFVAFARQGALTG